MATLKLIALDDVVVFPGMDVTLPIDVENESHVFLVPRHDNDYASVGVVAKVGDRLRLPGGLRAQALSGLHRGIAGAAQTDEHGDLRVAVEDHDDQTPPPDRTQELEREYRAVVDEILELRGDDGRIRAFVRSITEPGALADTAGYSPDLSYEQKVRLLQALDVVERLQLALELQRNRLAELQLRKRIREDVDSGTQKQQREYFLRKQMDSIRKELGEDEASVADEYRTKIAAAGMPDAVREQAERELARLERMGDSSGESSMIRTYLDWLIAVPWSKRSEEHLDPVHARQVLDADHAGLEDVKRRITEYLAVRKLRSDRGMADDRRSGAILTLIGPPGTGKTSIGESIARATGRAFVRMSLGGVRDEAEIRGHRRTYIGALPGRLVRALRDAGTMNPVILLDEVDKVGADWRGDPSAALLEVLDPAQNSTFRDNYLAVSFDLSRVMFIGTANVIDTIPGPLRDRMEIIEIPGYTEEEKVEIAKRYLMKRQLEATGLQPSQCEIADDAIRAIIEDYTREAGVRNLEREIGAICHNAAMKIAEGKTDRVKVEAKDLHGILGARRFESEVAMRTSVPGVATGLAWTPTGGDILFVECARVPGSGKLILTGQLGDVMKESAQAALSLVKARSASLGIDESVFEKSDIHLHVPAGAIPKDGPSAGVAMFIAIVSLLTGRTVKSDVAMTGEISLRGLVLPIGGVKNKALAAMRAGITTVLLPERNRKDFEEIPEGARQALNFVWLSTVDDAIAAAF